MAKITNTVHQTQLAMILRSPTGAVAKDLMRRGKNVEKAAKLNLEREPRRIDTGRLRSDIKTKLITIGGAMAVRVGTSLYYAMWVHDGTGIYGPKGKPILPTTAQYMRWKGKNGKYRFARQVRGMRPNRFLKDALPAAKG